MPLTCPRTIWTTFFLQTRACRIKNTPLPAKYTTLEEDLLPGLPEGGAGAVGMVAIQAGGFFLLYSLIFPCCALCVCSWSLAGRDV